VRVRGKLTVGPEGQIAVPPRQAESLGLAGGGEVDFVTARGACALVVPVRSDQPKAWFAGSLAALTVPEIVQFVFSSLKTGVLLLSFGKGDAARPDDPEQLRRKSIYFRDGQVVYASSSDRADRLGPVLAEGGFVANDELERCSRLVRSGRPLGQVLIDEGVLTSGQLYEAITLQVRRIFLSAFLETAGGFAFVEGPIEGQDEVKLPERTRDLVLQGMKASQEAEVRRAGAGAPQAPPEEIAIEVAPQGAPDDERGFAASTDLEVPAAAPPSAGGGARIPRAAGPFETYRRIFRRVHAALAAVQPDAAGRLNTWFERLPEKRRGIFAGVRMGDDGELDVAAILVNAGASGAYQGAAARARSLEALEEFLAFALFEAKNRLPRAEVERLLREVGKMQVGKA
jgi:hypothetical protein